MKFSGNTLNRLSNFFSSIFNRSSKLKTSQRHFSHQEERYLWDHPLEACNPMMKKVLWRNIEKECGFTRVRHLHSNWGYIAAACCVGVIFSVSLGWYIHTRTITSFTHLVACSDTTYVLPDASTVLLKKGSKMRFVTDFAKKRDVWLEGNALFEVKKSQGKSFRVHLNKAFIEVKGTKFLVEQQVKGTHVVLFNGKIEFNVAATKDKYILHPMDNLAYNYSTGETLISSLEQIAYEDGRYVFTDIHLKDLTQIIGQLYNVEVEFGKGIDPDATLTGSIDRSEELRRVIRKISYTLNLDYEFDKNKIVLKRDD